VLIVKNRKVIFYELLNVNICGDIYAFLKNKLSMFHRRASLYADTIDFST